MTDGISSGNTTAMISEHDVTRVMAGNIESVRQRLVTALEQLGFRVMSENPLRAKHPARGGAAYYMSANALEYPTRLEISLKPQGQGATQVTFDYQVQHGAFGKGDRQTLTREAEAIVALASQRAQAMSCVGCGVEVAADSRFCRKCGAPVKVTAPAELEVMRLTAGSRAGYQWTLIGVGILILSALLPLIIALRDKPMGKGLWVWLMLNAIGLWSLGAGLRRTHLTLNPKQESDELRLPPTIPTPITNELPQPVAYHSITEGTTDLLPALDEAEVIPVSRPKERSQA